VITNPKLKQRRAKELAKARREPRGIAAHQHVLEQRTRTTGIAKFGNVLHRAVTAAWQRVVQMDASRQRVNAKGKR
jgi:RecB family exonuclease